MDKRWKPYYIFRERTRLVSYRIKIQLTGATTKIYAVELRSTKVDERSISDEKNRPIRKVTLAAHMRDRDSVEGIIEGLPREIIESFGECVETLKKNALCLFWRMQ